MYCRQQLADFQKNIAEFEKRDIRIMGVSIDPASEAEKTKARYKLTIPLAYGVDAVEFSRLTGTFYNPENLYLDGAGFLIDPTGTVRGAVYSTGPIGRYTPRECWGMIDYFNKKDAAKKAEDAAAVAP